MEWMKNYLLGRQMRTMIRGKFSSWRDITSGVPQGAVLAPIMFLVFVNDMPNGVNTYMNMFADDAKVMKHIKNISSCRELQSDLNKLYDWSQHWKMEFNAKKCHVLEMGRSKHRPTWEYKMGNEIVRKAKEEKDLGIMITDDLSPEKHINKIIGGVYALLTNIRVAFNYLHEEMLSKIIASILRPRLEYAAVVWSPHLKKHINKLEKVQRVATKMLPMLRDLQYEERLEKLGLPTLKKRRERGDMIMMYRCTRGTERIDKVDFIERDNGSTRGHEYKLRKGRCKSDVKKFSFPYRSVEDWNSLKEEVVRAMNIHSFKVKLDKSRIRDGTTRA